MAVGGRIHMEKRNPIEVKQNTYIKHEIQDEKKYQEIKIFGGHDGTMNTDTNSQQKHFKISKSTGRNIFDYILGIDGNTDDLTAKDFKGIDEKKLQQKFGKSVKVLTKDEQSMKAVIQYNYDGESKATITIDMESDGEKQTREADEKAKAKEEQKQRAEAEKQREAKAKKDEKEEDWHKNFNDPFSKFLKFLGF